MTVRDIESEYTNYAATQAEAFRAGFLKALEWTQAVPGNMPELGSECEIISGSVIFPATFCGNGFMSAEGFLYCATHYKLIK
jgi:hypothetical protein